MNLIPVRYLLPKGAYIESLTGYICVDVMGQVGWVDAGEREGETGLSVKRRGGGGYVRARANEVEQTVECRYGWSCSGTRRAK